MSKAYVLLSGGMDSTTCLAMAIHEFGPAEVTAISIKYGQRHVKELTHARTIARELNVNWDIINLTGVVGKGGLTDLNLIVPDMSYDELPEGISPTYVPFRNGLMLAALASRAQADKDARFIYYGAHSEDAARDAYPDCSQAFIQSMGDAIRIGTYGQITLRAPFMSLTKADIVEQGHQLKVPFELTWSCYKGGQIHCGTCPTCQSRIMAFDDAGIEDPTEYGDDNE